MFGGKRRYIYFHTSARKEYKHCVKTDNQLIYIMNALFLILNSKKVNKLEYYFKGILCEIDRIEGAKI